MRTDFREMGTELGASLDEKKHRLSDMQESLKEHSRALMDRSHELFDRSRDAARMTDTYVHEHSWKAIGVTLAFGLIIGLLMNRK